MSRPWHRMFWGDFIADTAHLSNEELGAYTRLMGHYYITGKPLPDSPPKLRRIAHLSKYKWSNFREIFSDFFSKRDEFFYHKRIDKELSHSAEISEKRAESGRKGGLAKAKANAKQTGYKPELDKSFTVTNVTAQSVWDIAEANGIPRSLVGKLCKDYPETAVANAVAEVSLKRPADPKAFLLGLLKANPKRGAKRDWERVPFEDEELWGWAKKHGYPDPGSKTYREYRSYLNSLVTRRRDREEQP